MNNGEETIKNDGTTEGEVPLQSPAWIKEANDAADRLEKENDKLLKLLERQEQVALLQQRGGQATAGIPEPVKDENADAKNFLKGTGYADVLFPDKKE